RAIDMPTMDHRGPGFTELSQKALEGIKSIFKTRQPVIIFPSSGTGAWEAALVNTLSPGDRVLMYETGHFASLWKALSQRIGLVPDVIPGDWRSGVDPNKIEERLAADKGHEIKAVCVVHNETSTGCKSAIDEVRRAIDAAGHPALLLVDTISSLGSMDYRHDEWGVDVTVAGSQKGLLLPPGLSFNAVSEKALEASKHAALSRSYWAWDEMIAANANAVFPYTPATNLLYGLVVAVDMLNAEGLDNVFVRHARHAAATRAAVQAWGLDVLCANSKDYSSSLTAVLMPEGHSADGFRKTVLDSYNMSLGNGLSRLADKVFRIGHLGDFNDLMLMGTLSGVELGLRKAGVPHRAGGTLAAIDALASDDGSAAIAAQ
ncbi:MAG: pyridoxal-phosphate-dependent aminotransferase family protein, partial [Hyphomicrobiaceae bacterium]